MGSSYSAPAEVQSKYFPEFEAKLPSQEGKTHVVTGTTSGTGFVLAKCVAGKGGRVLCLNRPSERAEKALADIKGAVPDADVVQVDCDLQSFESVRAAAAKVTELCPEGVDVLTNNAGVMALPDEATVDGFDVQMQVNHLSHFLLTKELWPLLEKAAERTGEARVVNHSSGARKLPRSGLGREYLERNGGNLGGDANGVMMNGPRFKRYGHTKLANVVFTYALADRIEAAGKKIKAAVAHPGLAATQLQVTSVREGGMWQNPLTALFMRLSQSMEDGAMGVIQCAAGPSEEVTNGSFFGPGGAGISGPAVSLPRAKETLADRQESKDMLWECSEAAVGPFKI